MQEEQFRDQIIQSLAAVAAKSYESMVELAHGLDDKAQKTGLSPLDCLRWDWDS
jgi:hypothetical protein